MEGKYEKFNTLGITFQSVWSVEIAAIRVKCGQENLSIVH